MRESSSKTLRGAVEHRIMAIRPRMKRPRGHAPVVRVKEPATPVAGLPSANESPAAGSREAGDHGSFLSRMNVNPLRTIPPYGPSFSESHTHRPAHLRPAHLRRLDRHGTSDLHDPRKS